MRLATLLSLLMSSTLAASDAYPRRGLPIRIA